MSNKESNINNSIFESIKEIDEYSNEYWSARKLSKILGYAEYRNFKPVIVKAQEACKNSNQNTLNHFVEMHEMVRIGSGAERRIEDVKLSRYACYLNVQNADPAKEIVAQGQTYFAVQTRIQEIREMDAYNQLTTEDQRRLFLRNELAKHNTQLATSPHI